MDYSKYPPDWEEIRNRILKRANNHCEGSPHYPDCRAKNHKPHPITKSKVVLTIAHLDHNPTNWDIKDKRLRAWCQRCHLRYDLPNHLNNRKYGRNWKRNQLCLIGLSYVPTTQKIKYRK